MLYGFSYAVLSPVWGWLADRLSSTLVILLGALLLGLGSLLIGQSVILHIYLELFAGFKVKRSKIFREWRLSIYPIISSRHHYVLLSVLSCIKYLLG